MTTPFIAPISAGDRWDLLDIEIAQPALEIVQRRELAALRVEQNAGLAEPTVQAFCFVEDRGILTVLLPARETAVDVLQCVELAALRVKQTAGFAERAVQAFRFVEDRGVLTVLLPAREAAVDLAQCVELAVLAFENRLNVAQVIADPLQLWNDRWFSARRL